MFDNGGFREASPAPVIKRVFQRLIWLALLALPACQSPPSDRVGERGAETVSAVDEADSALIFLTRTLGPATGMQLATERGETRALLPNRKWRDRRPVVNREGEVAFMSNRHPGSRLSPHRRQRFRVFVLEDGEPVPLDTPEGASAMTPQWSPGGEGLAYVVVGADRSTLRYRAEWSDASSARGLWSARDILDFDWSPGGRRMAAVLFEPGDSRLEVRSLSDSDAARIEPRAEGAVITAVSWSPDGGALAFIVNRPDRERRLYLYDLATGERRLVSGPGQHVQEPVRWSDDGQRLLYASLVDFDFRYDEAAREKRYDGRMQVFLSDRRGNARPVTDGPGRHGAPVFSPDGERIGFLYGERLDARRLSVRTVNLEGKDERVLYENAAPESHLQWTALLPNQRR